MSAKPIRILLLEDNPTDAQIMQEALGAAKDGPFTVTWVKRTAEAVAQLKQGGFDLVLSDLSLPDSQGLDTMDRLLPDAGTTPVIVLTSLDDQRLAATALQRGAQDYLVKGYVQVYPDLLARSMRYAVERKRAQEEMRQAQERHWQLLEAISSILIGISPDGLVTHWNRVAETTFGVTAEQAVKRLITELPITWEQQRVWAGVAECRNAHRVVRIDDVGYARPDGQPGILGLTVNPVAGDTFGRAGFLIFGADITERKRADEALKKAYSDLKATQQELIQSEKLSALGRFALGVAHEVKNPLAVILGGTEYLQFRLPAEDAETHDTLKKLEEATLRADEIVRGLLRFARPSPLRIEPVKPEELVHEALDLFKNRSRLQNIEMVTRFGHGEVRVHVDKNQLQQALFNILLNAVEAMPKGGTLTVTTGTAAPPGWPAGVPCCVITVSDNGEGIAPEHLPKLFEPFFTTKRDKKGTGLGLSIAKMIMDHHKGEVTIESRLGAGTQVCLVLPRQEETAIR